MGWEEMGLERGWSAVCVTCWNRVFCDGMGGGIEEGMEQELTCVSFFWGKEAIIISRYLSVHYFLVPYYLSLMGGHRHRNMKARAPLRNGGNHGYFQFGTVRLATM